MSFIEKAIEYFNRNSTSDFALLGPLTFYRPKYISLFRAYSAHAPHNFRALFARTAPDCDTASIICSRTPPPIRHSAEDLTRIRKSCTRSLVAATPRMLPEFWSESGRFRFLLRSPLASARFFFFSRRLSSTGRCEPAVAFGIHQGWSCGRNSVTRSSRGINLSVAVCLPETVVICTLFRALRTWLPVSRMETRGCVVPRDYSVGMGHVNDDWMRGRGENPPMKGSLEV